MHAGTLESNRRAGAFLFEREATAKLITEIAPRYAYVAAVPVANGSVLIAKLMIACVCTTTQNEARRLHSSAEDRVPNRRPCPDGSH